MSETLPLSKIQAAILEFLQGREDAVLFGAQAVNAYTSDPRMTQDIDLLLNRADELAEELRVFLSEKFHIAVRVRAVADGKGFRDAFAVSRIKGKSFGEFKVEKRRRSDFENLGGDCESKFAACE